MAFVSGDAMRSSSSSNGLANGISDQQAQSQVGQTTALSHPIRITRDWVRDSRTDRWNLVSSEDFIGELRNAFDRMFRTSALHCNSICWPSSNSNRQPPTLPPRHRPHRVFRQRPLNLPATTYSTNSSLPNNSNSSSKRPNCHPNKQTHNWPSNNNLPLYKTS